MPEQLPDETAPARLYHPEDIAAALGCSAWWVKDRARRRLIPFTRVGRAYRFTAEHLAEIIRINEERPTHAPQRPLRQATFTSPTPRPPLRQRPQSPASATSLRARPPRRARQAEFGTAA